MNNLGRVALGFMLLSIVGMLLWIMSALDITNDGYVNKVVIAFGVAFLVYMWFGGRKDD